GDTQEVALPGRAPDRLLAVRPCSDAHAWLRDLGDPGQHILDDVARPDIAVGDLAPLGVRLGLRFADHHDDLPAFERTDSWRCRVWLRVHDRAIDGNSRLPGWAKAVRVCCHRPERERDGQYEQYSMHLARLLVSLKHPCL